ncbi:hypothetical protein ABKV19_009579 [Rosa sericea]
MAKSRIVAEIPSIVSKLLLFGIQMATFTTTGAQIVVCHGNVKNERLQDISSNQASADDWVQKNVVTYGNVNFKYVAVGNEIDATGPLAPFVGPAMEKIQNAISKAGLANKIKVFSAVHPIILQESSAPSIGPFRPNYRPFLDPIISFLVGKQSPLLHNTYPYFSYIDNRAINLQYALLVYHMVSGFVLLLF